MAANKQRAGQMKDILLICFISFFQLGKTFSVRGKFSPLLKLFKCDQDSALLPPLWKAGYEHVLCFTPEQILPAPGGRV